MNKYIKGAFIFAGGMTAGFVVSGIGTIKLALKSTTIRNAVKDNISDDVDVVVRFLLDEQYERQILTDDIIFDTDHSAIEVIRQLDEVFNMYGFVTVADLKDLSGVPTNYKDATRGWNDLDSITKIRVAETNKGYQLKTPQPLAIKR